MDATAITRHRIFHTVQLSYIHQKPAKIFIYRTKNHSKVAIIFLLDKNKYLLRINNCHDKYPSYSSGLAKRARDS